MNFIKKITGKMGAGGGAFILAVASFLSYFLGLIRDPLMAYFFGAGFETDAYGRAFLIPDFILNFLIMGALSGVLMSSYVGLKNKSQKRAEDMFWNFLVVMNFLVILGAIITYFFVPSLVNVIFDNLSLEEREVTINLTRILLFSPVFFALSNTLGSVLLGEKKFFSVAFAPVFYNLGIIFGIIFSGRFGFEAVAWGTIFGAFLHFGCRFVDFRSFFKNIKKVQVDNRQIGNKQVSDKGSSPLVEKKDHLLLKNIFQKDFLRVLFLSLPRTVGLLAFQGMLWGFHILASENLGEGDISAFNYARNIQSLSVSLFGIALVTGVFPFFCEYYAKKDEKGFLYRLEKTARQILFLALPACFGLYLVASDVVVVILARGSKFDLQDIHNTTVVLLFLAISIPFESLTHLFSRAFLSRDNTWIPMIGQLLFFGFSVFGSYFLIGDYGVMSFGISFMVGEILQFLFLFVVFNLFYFRFPFLKFFSRFYKTLILSCLMGFLVWGCLYFLADFSSFLRLLLSILLAIGFYFLGAFLWGMDEVERVRSYVRERSS